ncbi:hypothetical protein PENSPDRAFT_496844 [Peniophora sp. CONT]|nr:hypothetical protein PENSPDRAFT_496844 [Peniophora sp. CONT]
MASSAASPPRRHRKRISVARLSSDTTATLPAYSLSPYARSTPNFANVARGDEDEFGDDPPSYEADDDSSEDDVRRRVPLSPPPPLHRRRNSRAPAPLRPSPRLPPSHRSRPSTSSMSPLALSPSRVRSRSASAGGSESESNDPNLDNLLARSIQALEVSNALLQSSMNTQSSLAAIAANDSPPHSAPPREPPQLPVPEHRTLPAAVRQPKPPLDLDMDGISQSLPTGPSPLQQRLRSHTHTRIRSSSSTDLRLKNDAGDVQESASAGNLHLGVAGRSRFVSPAPRALTQYVDFDPRENPDDASFQLPSTLGLRATGSTHSVPSTAQSPIEGVDGLPDLRIDGLLNASSPPKKPSTYRPGRAAPLPPPIQAREASRSSETPPTPSASSLLSSFLARRPSSSAAGKNAHSPVLRPTKRRASIETASAELPRPISYHYDPTQTQLPHRAPASLSSTPSSSTTVLRSSRSPTPTRGNRAAPPTPLILPTRAMTPPIEVSSPSPDSEDYSRSSSDIPQPVLSVQALRRIMADQPPAPPRGLQPRTPAVPTVGTSHATASISRLFTRGTHMHAGSIDARAARRSALKRSGVNGSVPPSPSVANSEQGSQPPTPSASFLGLHLPFGGSASSSGRSTPNGTRVSFGPLPDDTTGSGSKSSRTRSRSRSRSRRKGKGLARSNSGEVDGGAEGWWAAWLMGGPSAFGEVPVASAVVRDRKPYGRSYHGMEDFAI